MSFTEIPILDLALARDPATKPGFLADLRHALMEVGFLYLKNVGISDELFARVIKEGRAFFDIPAEENLGDFQCTEDRDEERPLVPGLLAALGEITAGQTDHREQIDLSTEHPVPGPDAPRHHNLLAPNQWPSASVLPDFRPVFAEYMARMGSVSVQFTSLIAEAVGLPPDAFDKYFDGPGAVDQQHKLKIVKYPDVAELGLKEGQGVGPHKDSMLTSYLLQASAHRGLQVQNMRGQWIDCPPLDGTLVVAIGQGLEALTQGVCCSTTHRVLSPAAGEGRYSIPFFQGVRSDATFADLEGVGMGTVPQDVRDQRRKVFEANSGCGGIRLDDVEFTFRGGGVAKTLGEATLRNRVKSHPDVGERWYPDILRDIREQQAREARENKDEDAGVVGKGADGAASRAQSNATNNATTTAVEAH
ncbi:Clavaminate synthase-like protein [Apiospora phragmitis]|uniref:Clavaminate synthase-like protein n=1 Tax=Apiospora phragmitis TaxID=2905665 RepID=A0ABR1V1N0_9PEZI